jgi:hypothetical protein
LKPTLPPSVEPAFLAIGSAPSGGRARDGGSPPAAVLGAIAYSPEIVALARVGLTAAVVKAARRVRELDDKRLVLADELPNFDRAADLVSDLLGIDAIKDSIAEAQRKLSDALAELDALEKENPCH